MASPIETAANFIRRYNVYGIKDTGGYTLGAVNSPSGVRQATGGGSWAVKAGNTPNNQPMTQSGVGFPVPSAYGLPGAVFGFLPSGASPSVSTLTTDGNAPQLTALTRLLVVRTPMRPFAVQNYADNTLTGSSSGIIHGAIRHPGGGGWNNMPYAGVQVGANNRLTGRAGNTSAAGWGSNVDTTTASPGVALGSGREIVIQRLGVNRNALHVYRNGVLLGASQAGSPGVTDQQMFDYWNGDDNGAFKFPFILDDWSLISRDVTDDAELLAMCRELAGSWPLGVCTSQLDCIGDSMTCGMKSLGGLTFHGLLAHWFPTVFVNPCCAASSDVRHWAQQAFMNAMVSATVEPGHLISRRKALFFLGHNAQLNGENTNTWKADFATAIGNWCVRTGRSPSDVFVVTPMPVAWAADGAARAAMAATLRTNAIAAAAAAGVPAANVLDLHTAEPSLGMVDGTAYGLGLVGGGWNFQQAQGPSGAALANATGISPNGLNDPGAPIAGAKGTDYIHLGPGGQVLLGGTLRNWSRFVTALGVVPSTRRIVVNSNRNRESERVLTPVNAAGLAVPVAPASNIVAVASGQTHAQAVEGIGTSVRYVDWPETGPSRPTFAFVGGYGTGWFAPPAGVPLSVKGVRLEGNGAALVLEDLGTVTLTFPNVEGADVPSSMTGGAPMCGPTAATFVASANFAAEGRTSADSTQTPARVKIEIPERFTGIAIFASGGASGVTVRPTVSRAWE